MTEKITRDRIEHWREHLTYIEPLHVEELEALCTLALQALEMQPRPIEEYTGSVGPVIVYVPKDRWIDAWYSKANRWWTSDIYGLADKKNEKNFVVEPSHFIPLTSLPEPRR